MSHIAPYQNSTSNNTINTLSWPHKCLHLHVNRPKHFCSKFLRLDINSFDVRSKIRSGGTGGCRHRGNRDRLETQVIPDLVPVQLTIIPSNSKSDQNMMCSGLKCTLPITTKLCTHHDSIKILLRLVEHILKYSTPNYDRISNSIKISLVGWGPGRINEHPIAESNFYPHCKLCINYLFFHDLLLWKMYNISCLQ